MSELKPCPFCGKQPVWIRSYSKDRLYHQCDVIRINMSWGKKSELTRLWNTRYKPDGGGEYEHITREAMEASLKPKGSEGGADE